MEDFQNQKYALWHETLQRRKIHGLELKDIQTCKNSAKYSNTRETLPVGNHKLGIFSWYGIPLSIRERIRAIKEAGFDSTGIWLSEQNRWETDPEDIPKIIRDNGLLIDYAHAPYQSINDIWYESKSENIESLLRASIDYCARHRIPILVTHLTKGFRIKQATDHGIRILRSLVAYAKDRNVAIAAENNKFDEVVAGRTRDSRSSIWTFALTLRTTTSIVSKNFLSCPSSASGFFVCICLITMGISMITGYHSRCD